MDKKFVPTNKKLTWTITIFYILMVIAVGAVNVIFPPTNLSYLLGYILPLESIIIVAYFGKSGLEKYLETTNQVAQIVPITTPSNQTTTNTATTTVSNTVDATENTSTTENVDNKEEGSL